MAGQRWGAGAVAVLSSSGKQAFLPSGLHRLRAAPATCPPGWAPNPAECLSAEEVQARKTTKMMKKTMRMRKILTMSQRLEVTDWKYLRISECAASTSSWAPITFSSILEAGRSGHRTG